jgi:TatD DNase family protein
MNVIDSHCHLETKDFGDEREAVIERARAAGVKHFVVVGSGDSLANVHNAIKLAESGSDMSAAIGIHPHDVARMSPDALDVIEQLAATHPRVVAVGETGLDYHYNYSPPESQRAHFRDFIRIAQRTGKPLTLHIRDAHAEARAILVEEHGFDVPVIVHCFTGTPDDAREWIALGAWLSFSGIVTFKTAAGLREACADAPANRILVETDCPYLAPIPYRGKRNEPAYVIETLKVVAQARRISMEEAAALTVENTVRAFGLRQP